MGKTASQVLAKGNQLLRQPVGDWKRAQCRRWQRGTCARRDSSQWPLLSSHTCVQRGCSAGLETCDTAGLEACATSQRRTPKHTRNSNVQAAGPGF